MYKYIKGVTVVSDKKMKDSFEIAEEYHLWMPLDKDTLVPNGTFVDFLVSSYMEQHNHKASEYYYINSKNIALRVYPEEMIEPIMHEFMKYLNINNVQSDKEKILQMGDIPFIYYEKPVPQAKIYNFEEFKKRKENKQ